MKQTGAVAQGGTTMRQVRRVLLVGLFASLGLLFVNDASNAQKEKDRPKLDLKRLKKILGKIDPEIKASQVQLNAAKKALEQSKAKLTAAINDEVFGEKGATEGAVIDQLKLAISSTDKAVSDVNAALREVNKAQRLDKTTD